MDNYGKFIVIDGMDGSGKGTQIRLLQDRLASHRVLFTREPGGSARAEVIRDLILADETPSNPTCDFFLFWAARGSHVQDIVEPALRAGTHVICDRYDSSTHAFQIHGEQSDEWLARMFLLIRDALPRFYVPDLYIVLDLEPRVAYERRAKDAAQAKTKFDVQPLDYHERVRAGFKDFARHHDKVAFVDAHGTPDEIHTQMWRIVSSELAIA